MRVLVLALLLAGCSTEIKRDGNYHVLYCVGACILTTEDGQGSVSMDESQ